MNELYYNDQTTLERAIISCLLMKPEMTDQLIVEPKHFQKYRGMLLFLQNFYKQFRNYDLILMSVVAVNKTQLVAELSDLITNCEPTTANFQHYQRKLIDLQEFEIIEKRRINSIINLTMQLKAREISVAQFKKEVEKI